MKLVPRTFILGALLLTSCVSVETTEWCVETRYGNVTKKRVDPGLTGVMTVSVTCFPMIERVFPADSTEMIEAQTGDPITILGDVAIVYKYDPATVFDSVFMKHRDDDVAQAQILNAIRAGYRDAVSKWVVSPETRTDSRPNIVTQRSALSDSVRVNIQRKLGGRAIVVNTFVRNIKLPESIEQARTAAVQKTSLLDAAMKQLAIDSANAKGTLITANANAESKRLEAGSYSANPQLLQLEIAKQYAKLCEGTTNCVIGGSVADLLFGGKK